MSKSLPTRWPSRFFAQRPKAPLFGTGNTVTSSERDFQGQGRPGLDYLPERLSPVACTVDDGVRRLGRFAGAVGLVRGENVV